MKKNNGLSSLPGLGHPHKFPQSIGGVKEDILNLKDLGTEGIRPVDWSLGLRRNYYTNTSEEPIKFSSVGKRQGR